MKLKTNKPEAPKIAVIGSGMKTGVGIDSPSSCAAIRCKLNNYVETEFMDRTGERVIGSYVQLGQALRGRAKLLHLIVSPIKECLDMMPDPDALEIALLLCVPEGTRPGSIQGLDDQFLEDIQAELSFSFSNHSQVIPGGRVGGVVAVQKGMDLLRHETCRYCIVAGVDTFLTGGTIASYESKSRLLTGENSDGFIPGEAGSAVLLGPLEPGMKQVMTIQGIGFGFEAVHIESQDPLRADGMVQTINAALQVAGLTMGDLDYRMTDVNGEQYVFKEAALAQTRLLRELKERFDIWHPADCVGEIGAAIVPCSLGVVLTAARKKYAPGNRVLCHYGNDDGQRGAIILQSCEYGG